MVDSAKEAQAIDLFLELEALRRQIEAIACDCSVYEIKLRHFVKRYAAADFDPADQLRQFAAKSGLQVREISTNCKRISETINEFSGRYVTSAPTS